MHTNYYDSFENQLRHENSEIIDVLNEVKLQAIAKINNVSDTQFFSLSQFMHCKRITKIVQNEIEQLRAIPQVKLIFDFMDKYPPITYPCLAKINYN